MRRLFAFFVLATLLVAPRAFAASGFPDYLVFPPEITEAPDQSIVEEAVGATSIIQAADGVAVDLQGHHFSRWMAYVPKEGDPAPGYDNGTEKRIHDAVADALKSAGWTIVFTDPGLSPFSAHYDRDGKDAWLQVKMDAPQAQVYFDLVELGGGGPSISFDIPSDKAEKIPLKKDLPYLAPWPGSTRAYEGHDDNPLDVAVPGQSQEPVLVGQGVDMRSYKGPETLSALQFIGESRKALIKAGWTIIYPADEASAKDFGSLAAHYTANGRDIWAKLSYEAPAQIYYAVVDIGAENWAAKLKKDCHIPLYGVFFDFNKTSLKPESDSALQKVASLLDEKRKISAEIAGHTDSVGSDDYNLTLSEGRARSVVDWLTSHGIDAARLHAKGYGKTQPVADNDTDEGRARNRRVELVIKGCK